MDDDLLYTSVCSAATLQSNKQGFFQDFANGVTEKAGTEWLNIFGTLPNNREKILKCYSDSDVKDLIQETLQNVQSLYRTKSARLAYLRRSEAEHCMRSNNYEKALMLLNQSVIRSPSTGVDKTVDDGQTLPLTIWERAKVLFAVSEFSLCLNDIQLCLKEKLPDSLRFQAYYCMAECYEKLKQIKRAHISLQVASKLLSKEDSEWSAKIHEKKCSLAELNDEEIIQNHTEDLKVTLRENPALPSASCLLSVGNSLTEGRFVVAQQPIKTGDTLVIEAPYAACLLPEKFGSHCHHCFKRLHIAVPCPDCSGVAFCNIDCRDSAVKAYHKYECKYMDIMIGSGMSILCHIALRIITQQNPVHWFNINAGKDDDFKRLQELVTHSDKRPPKDYFHRTLMALFLLRILQCSGYIANSDDTGSLSEYELQVATIILHCLQCLQFNAHEIYETVMKREKHFKSAHMNYIAVGIYLTVSLFNHDCYPAVTRYFNGKHIIIKAVRPLSPGDAVGENYGPIFTKRTLSERTRNLKSRYWFRCSCKACQEDWSTFVTLDENVVRIRCMQKDCKGFAVSRLDAVKQKNVKCYSCKKTMNIPKTVALIKSYNEDFDKGINLMNSGNAEEAINIMCAFSDLMHIICAPPVKKVSLSHEALRTCWANAGNTYIVKGS